MSDQSSDKELIKRLRLPDKKLDVVETIVAERDSVGRELVWLRADLIKIAEALGILNERSNREHIEDAETKSFGYWRELASQITDAAASIRNGRV